MRGPLDQDPEVLAERRQRDRFAGRDDLAGGPTRPFASPVVERWPCSGDCGAFVDITRDALEIHAMFNRQLARRGDRPLAKRIPCAACKARDEDLARAQRRPHEQQAMRLDNERPGGRR